MGGWVIGLRSEELLGATIYFIDAEACDISHNLTATVASVPMSRAERQTASTKPVLCGNPFASDGSMEEYIKNLDKVARSISAV